MHKFLRMFVSKAKNNIYQRTINFHYPCQRQIQTFNWIKCRCVESRTFINILLITKSYYVIPYLLFVPFIGIYQQKEYRNIIFRWLYCGCLLVRAIRLMVIEWNETTNKYFIKPWFTYTIELSIYSLECLKVELADSFNKDFAVTWQHQI